MPILPEGVVWLSICKVTLQPHHFLCPVQFRWPCPLSGRALDVDALRMQVLLRYDFLAGSPLLPSCDDGIARPVISQDLDCAKCKQQTVRRGPSQALEPRAPSSGYEQPEQTL